MTRQPPIRVGDRFAKVGIFSRDFTVTSVIEPPGHPLHAVLSVSPGALTETVTLAVVALADPALFWPS